VGKRNQKSEKILIDSYRLLLDTEVGSL